MWKFIEWVEVRERGRRVRGVGSELTASYDHFHVKTVHPFGFLSQVVLANINLVHVGGYFIECVIIAYNGVRS